MNSVPCPACRQQLAVTEQFIGKHVRCPNCEDVFVVPRPNVAHFQVATEMPRPATEDVGEHAPDELGSASFDFSTIEPLPEEAKAAVAEVGEPVASAWTGRSIMFTNRTFIALPIFFAGMVLLFDFLSDAFEDGFDKWWSEMWKFMVVALPILLGMIVFGGYRLFVGIREKFRYPRAHLWLCRDGVIWQRKGEVGHCRLSEIENLKTFSKRAFNEHREFVFWYEYRLTCPGTAPFLIWVETGSIIYEEALGLRAFAIRLEQETTAHLLPSRRLALQQGQSVDFDPYKLSPKRLIDKRNGRSILVGRIARIVRKDTDLLIYDTDGSLWKKQPIATVSFASLLQALLEEMTQRAVPPRSEAPQGGTGAGNPFDFS